MADDEWEQMNVNERLQVAAQRLAERLKGFKPEIVPPDEREQEAERFRRLEERIAAHDRHHREQHPLPNNSQASRRISHTDTCP